MHDDEFLEKFEACTLPKEDFKHQEHLRIAWLYLSKYNFELAMKYITSGISRYTQSIGAEVKYHETLTRVWVYIVKHEMNQQTDTFAKFIKKHPELLDKSLPLQYFSKERLDSDQAKKKWIASDIKPVMSPQKH